MLCFTLLSMAISRYVLLLCQMFMMHLCGGFVFVLFLFCFFLGGYFLVFVCLFICLCAFGWFGWFCFVLFFNIRIVQSNWACLTWKSALEIKSLILWTLKILPRKTAGRLSEYTHYIVPYDTHRNKKKKKKLLNQLNATSAMQHPLFTTRRRRL